MGMSELESRFSLEGKGFKLTVTKEIRTKNHHEMIFLTKFSSLEY